MPIQLTQCWFLELAFLSNAKILIYFSNKIYKNNFIKLLWFEITKMLIAV